MNQAHKIQILLDAVREDIEYNRRSLIIYNKSPILFDFKIRQIKRELLVNQISYYILLRRLMKAESELIH